MLIKNVNAVRTERTSSAQHVSFQFSGILNPGPLPPNGEDKKQWKNAALEENCGVQSKLKQNWSGKLWQL